jgi:hypothetical protein
MIKRRIKILLSIVGLIVILIGFTKIYRIFGIYTYGDIADLINYGNTIIEEVCEKYSYEKKFGIIHIIRSDRFIQLNYLVYDEEIHEVYIGFDNIKSYFEGYDQHTIKELPAKYVKKQYPFLE